MLQAALLAAPLALPTLSLVPVQEGPGDPIACGRLTKRGQGLVEQDAETPQFEAMGYVSDWLRAFQEMHGVEDGLTGVVLFQKREAMMLLPGEVASAAFDRHFDGGLHVTRMVGEREPLAEKDTPTRVTLDLEIPCDDEEVESMAGELLCLAMGNDARLEVLDMPRPAWNEEREAWFVEGLLLEVAPGKVERQERRAGRGLKRLGCAEVEGYSMLIRRHAIGDQAGNMRTVIERRDLKARDAVLLDVELLSERPRRSSAACSRNFFFLLNRNTSGRAIRRIELTDQGPEKAWKIAFQAELIG